MKCSIIIFFWSISFTAFAGGVFHCPNIEELEGLSKQGGIKLENLNPDAKIRDIPADKSFFYFFDNFKNSKGDLTCFYENFPDLKQDINNLKINDLIKINENIELITSNQGRECYSKEISKYTGWRSWSPEAEKIHLLFKEFLNLHNKLNLPLQEVLKTCRPLTKDKELLTCMDLLESRLNVYASPHGGMGFKIPDTQFYQDNDFFTNPEKLPPILKNESTVDFFNNLTSESMTKTESINKLKVIKKDLEKDFKNVKTVSFSENSVGMHNPSNRLVISYEDKNCLYTYITSQKNFLGISLLGRHIHCWNDPQTGSKLETPIQYLMDFTIDDNKNYAPRKQTERCIDCHTRGPILFMSDKINHGKQEEVDELNHRLKQLPPAQWVTWDTAEKKYLDAFLAPRYRASQVYGPMFKYDDPNIDQMIKNAIPETDQMNLSEKEIINAVKNSASCSECHNPNFLGPLVKNNSSGFTGTHIKSYILSEKFNQDHERFIKGDFNPKQKKFLNYVLMNYLGVSSAPVALSNIAKLEENKWIKGSSIGQDDVFKCPKEENAINFFQQRVQLESVKNTISPAETCPTTFLPGTLGLQDPSETFFIPDWNKNDGGQNNKLICKPNGELNYPIMGTPSCTGTCHPYEVTLRFNGRGDFLGFTNEDCNNCNIGLKKYDPFKGQDSHLPLTASETKQLESYYLTTMSQQPLKHLHKENFQVDALSGATMTESFPFKGAGLMISDMGRYISFGSKYIQENLKDKCKSK